MTKCTDILCKMELVYNKLYNVNCTLTSFHCLFRSPWTALQCIGNGVIPQKKMRSKNNFPTQEAQFTVQ